MGIHAASMLTKAIRAIVGAIAPVLSRLAYQQFFRRGAEAGPPSGLVDLRPELDEALDVLAGGVGIGGVPANLKGVLSDRPSAFAHEMVREWVRTPQARASLKAAAVRADQDLDYQAQKVECLAAYAAVTGERARSGERYFDDALTFLRLTTRSAVSPEGRSLLQNANANREEVIAAIDPIARRLDALPTLLATAPVEVLDGHVVRALERVARRRSFAEADTFDDLDHLRADVSDGWLRRATAALRGDVLRAAAAESARRGDARSARDILDAARHLSPSHDHGIDEARLALCSGDAPGAMRLLHHRTDPTSASMMLDAIDERDGPGASVRYFEERQGDPTALTGGGLLALASRTFGLGRADDAYAMLLKANAAQVRDAGALLLVRMRIGVSLCLPDELRAGFALEAWSMPRAATLRDDVRGRGWLAAALADAHALESLAAEWDLPVAARHAALAATWLGLASLDEGERPDATGRLAAMLEDPEDAFAAVPLACEFHVAFDRARISRRLDDAAALGGWTPGPMPVRPAHGVLRST